MKVTKEGILFELKNFNSDVYQEIRFITKGNDGKYIDGTTNEEVISMMIERFYHLQKSGASPENFAILTLLKNIRRLLAKRLTRKIERLKVNE